MEAEGEKDLDGFVALVFDYVCQRGDGQTRRAVVERDEGAKGAEGYLERVLRLGEFDLGEGEFAEETRGFEAGETFRLADVAHAVLVGIAEEILEARRLDNAGVDRSALGSGVEGGESVAEEGVLVRFAEDFPVSEGTSAFEADAPGADSAKREGNFGQLVVGEPVRRIVVHHGRSLRAWALLGRTSYRR